MKISWTPRTLLTVSIVAIALLVAGLGFLGWKLFEQDRVLERQSVMERLARTADESIGNIRQHLEEISDQLGHVLTARAKLEEVAAALDFREDAVIVSATPRGVEASRPLIFYPDQPDPRDIVGNTFANVEKIELAGRDLPTALATYERFAASPDARVRAGALLRSARVARKLERPTVAFAAYDKLAGLGLVPAAGRPADLVALLEQLTISEQVGSQPATARAAVELDRGLRSGRWRLSRGEFYAYEQQLDAWRDHQAISASTSLAGPTALADGVAAAWASVLTIPTSSTSGWQTTSTVLTVWRRTGNLSAAFVATPAYATRTLWRGLPEAVQRERVLVTLVSDNGHVWFGNASGAQPAIRRSSTETGLPFAVAVSSADPDADSAVFSRRRWLLAGVFGIVGLLLIAGGYVAARGISKELEVARLQSDFVAAVSHELRTPVASVLQLSEVLDEGRVPDEQRRARYYGLLRRESERLQRLVEGLLDFGRMESDAAVYRFEVIDPEALVRQVAEDFAGSQGQAAKRIVVTTATALPKIRADREAISRALWNLLDNAAKYSPPESRVFIDTSAATDGIVISVRDEGPGIALEEQRQIFKKFVRGETARASGAKGTGLGLTMVAHIMRAHHGDVRVVSKSGAGATFSLALPLANESA